MLVYEITSTNKYNPLLLAVIMSGTAFVITSFFANLTVISAETYFKIVKPFHYLRLLTSRKCVAILAVLRILSFLAGVIVFLLCFFSTISVPMTCLEYLSQIDTVLFFVMDGIIAPNILLVTLCAAGLIRITIRHQYKIHRIQTEHRRVVTASGRGGAAVSDPGAVSRKNTVTSIVFFSSFLVCWIPILCAWNTLFIRKIHLSSVEILTALVCSSIVVLNQTAFGILIFMLRQSKYKIAVKKRVMILKSRLFETD